MNRGKDRKFSIPHSCVDFVVAVIGTGASPPVATTNGPMSPTVATFPARLNGISRVAAEIPTRSAQGRYVITYAHQLPVVFNATGTVLAAGGAPTGGLLCDVDSINPATRQIAIRVATQNGTLTDLGTSDLLVLTVNAQDSGA
jgi:hypothetical protein